MILYRIAKCNYVDDLSGTGARLYGGRWNSVGQPAVYLASSRSLAVLEVLVHLPPLLIPDSFCLVEVEVPESSIATVNTKELPENWQDVSSPLALKKLGDDFLKGKKNLLLKLPSAIVPMEYNYLLNPLHQDILQAKVIDKFPFNFDERLV